MYNPDDKKNVTEKKGIWSKFGVSTNLSFLVISAFSFREILKTIEQGEQKKKKQKKSGVRGRDKNWLRYILTSFEQPVCSFRRLSESKKMKSEELKNKGSLLIDWWCSLRVRFQKNRKRRRRGKGKKTSSRRIKARGAKKISGRTDEKVRMKLT